MSNSNELKVYTAQEVADILGVHRHTVGRYVRLGTIKAINTQGAIRVSHKELDRFINGGGDENKNS